MAQMVVGGMGGWEPEPVRVPALVLGKRFVLIGDGHILRFESMGSNGRKGIINITSARC